MIVLAAGMPRAGSGWHFNLVHDLMKAAGAAESRGIREQFRLQGILTEVNCNIGVLSARRLALLMLPAAAGKTFVIKAHSAPTNAFRLLSVVGILRATYIYRDPRDAMLSACEYGRRGLEKGRPNAFSHLTDFETSLVFMNRYVRIWEAWNREKPVHCLRYEDLLGNYLTQARGLADFLGLDVGTADVSAAIEAHHPGQGAGTVGYHFHRGQVGRFRAAYSDSHQATLMQVFGPALSRMGYAE